jgi:hypothetical protein
MKTTTLLTPLLFLSSAFAVPAPVPAANDGCVVTQVIYYDINNPFTLVAREPNGTDSENSTIDGKTLTILPVGSSGSWNIGIQDDSQDLNTTLTAGELSLADGLGKAYIVPPRDRSQFRTIEFAEDPETPATYEAYMKCIGDVGYTVIRPSKDDEGQGE